MSITVDRDVRVPMRDGVRLAADVYRPSGSGRSPCVLVRTPYDRSQAAAFALQVNAIQLADAGYAVVVQDVRGRYGSEGVFEPFWHEGTDGADTIEWAAEQPWSDGRVATAGTSYCGYAQVLAARERPEPLRAWVPAFCPADARHWVYEGGAFLLAFNLAWMLGSVVRNDPAVGDEARAAAVRALDDWASTVRRPISGLRELGAVAGGRQLAAWLEHADDAAWWEPLDGTTGEPQPGALVVGGWFDLFAHGTFELYRSVQARHPSGLVIGPWDHSPLPLATGSGDIDFGVAAAVDLPALELRWLDHVLRDGDRPVAGAARTFITGANSWADWTAWPPPAETRVLRPAMGELLDATSSPEGVDWIDADAAHPAPTVGGLVYPTPRAMRAGPLPQDVRGRRADVLGYATPALDRDVLVAGPVRADVWWTAAGEGADTVVTLLDIDSGGVCRNVAEGVTRSRAAHDAPWCAQVDLGHAAHLFRSGHRIGVHIAAASFPKIAPQPGAQGRRGLLRGGVEDTRLELPVLA